MHLKQKHHVKAIMARPVLDKVGLGCATCFHRTLAGLEKLFAMRNSTSWPCFICLTDTFISTLPAHSSAPAFAASYSCRYSSAKPAPMSVPLCLFPLLRYTSGTFPGHLISSHMPYRKVTSFTRLAISCEQTNILVPILREPHTGCNPGLRTSGQSAAARST